MIAVLESVLALAGVVRSGRCRCGHEREAHEHYRLGTECALCSQLLVTIGGRLMSVQPAECPRYRPTWRRA